MSAVTVQPQRVAVERPADDVEDDYERCGQTFRPVWQPTLWCSCDRPHGHTGDHFGTPRGGHWSSTLRIG